MVTNPITLNITHNNILLSIYCQYFQKSIMIKYLFIVGLKKNTLHLYLV